MKQLNFYKYLSLALIGINLLLVALLLFSAPRGKPGQRGNNMKNARTMMRLDEQQHDAFLQLAFSHQQGMDSLNQEHKKVLGTYFSLLTDESQTLQADELLPEIQQIERQKITSTYQHFLEVKNLLSPEQEEGFENFVKSTLNFFSDGPTNRPGPPRPRREN